MIWLLILWLGLIVVEIARHHDLIENDKQRPVYWKVTVERIFVGFIFWVASPFTWKEMTYWQWWGMVPMMVFTFWYCFDYGLIIARNLTRAENLPFYYLNPEEYLLDRLQCNYPNAYVWFWWKLMLMITGVALFHYGLDYIWNGV